MKDTKMAAPRPQAGEGGTNENLAILTPNESFFDAERSVSGSDEANSAVELGKVQPSWRRLLADCVRDPDELCDLLELPDEFRIGARSSAKLFPLVVPRSYVARMRKGDPNDPLLLQVLPAIQESEKVEGFTKDPVGEQLSEHEPGVLQKYHGRALFVLTGVCAIHCRYCFRRHYPYEESPRGIDAWDRAIAAVESDASLDEVILSGGDPLTLTDDWLRRFVAKLAPIGHLKRLRIHTRLPIVLPERVTDELIDWLTNCRLQPIVVVHANHANELAGACGRALRKLTDAGVMVLNQTVLLRGINDNAATLAELNLRLIEQRVLPYYLHQLDRVAGAAHFEVEEARGLAIVKELTALLPGYAVPKYVREIAGEPSKTPISSGCD